jgi:hypothetical protein
MSEKKPLAISLYLLPNKNRDGLEGTKKMLAISVCDPNMRELEI